MILVKVAEKPATMINSMKNKLQIMAMLMYLMISGANAQEYIMIQSKLLLDSNGCKFD